MTTRTLTPDEQRQALDLLEQFTHWSSWEIGVGSTTRCRFCDRVIDSKWELTHHDDCPVARAAELLAAVDSAQEAEG